MTKIAIIGGTGLSAFDRLEGAKKMVLDTPYGATSAMPQAGKIEGIDVVFLPRHGDKHTIPPHAINYRANLWALNELDVSHIIAVNAVGGIGERYTAGSLCVPDQIVDYSYGRAHSFSDGPDVALRHIDFTWPYDEALRLALIEAAQSRNLACHNGAVYAASQGPRLETAAEILRMERDGCDVVGMTGMPEAALARELDLAYASICLVVNPAAGKAQGIITMEAIEAVMELGILDVSAMIDAYLLGLS